MRLRFFGVLVAVIGFLIAGCNGSSSSPTATPANVQQDRLPPPMPSRTPQPTLEIPPIPRYEDLSLAYITDDASHWRYTLSKAETIATLQWLATTKAVSRDTDAPLRSDVPYLVLLTKSGVKQAIQIAYDCARSGEGASTLCSRVPGQVVVYPGDQTASYRLRQPDLAEWLRWKVPPKPSFWDDIMKRFGRSTYPGG